MVAYIIRRLLLIVPTLFFIMLINSLVIQAAPGGPVEQLISEITGEGTDVLDARGQKELATKTLEKVSDDGLGVDLGDDDIATHMKAEKKKADTTVRLAGNVVVLPTRPKDFRMVSIEGGPN